MLRVSPGRECQSYEKIPILTGRILWMTMRFSPRSIPRCTSPVTWIPEDDDEDAPLLCG